MKTKGLDHKQDVLSQLDQQLVYLFLSVMAVYVMENVLHYTPTSPESPEFAMHHYMAMNYIMDHPECVQDVEREMVIPGGKRGKAIFHSWRYKVVDNFILWRWTNKGGIYIRERDHKVYLVKGLENGLGHKQALFPMRCRATIYPFEDVIVSDGYMTVEGNGGITKELRAELEKVVEEAKRSGAIITSLQPEKEEEKPDEESSEVRASGANIVEGQNALTDEDDELYMNLLDNYLQFTAIDQDGHLVSRMLEAIKRENADFTLDSMKSSWLTMCSNFSPAKVDQCMRTRRTPGGVRGIRIFKSWKRMHINERCLFLELTDAGAILVNLENKNVYLVQGAEISMEEIAEVCPSMGTVCLFPFEDKILVADVICMDEKAPSEEEIALGKRYYMQAVNEGKVVTQI